MKYLLDALLPRLFPGWVALEHFQCVAHEGKSDLDRSIPRKLSSWRIPGDRFVVVRDNDNAHCVEVKAHLKRMCEAAGRPETLVRLVCQELEGWYLGDLAALARAFAGDKIDTPAHRKRFMHPDQWQKPSVEVKRLATDFQKGSGARAMAEHMQATGNRSVSFGFFVAGVMALAESMGYRAPALSEAVV